MNDLQERLKLAAWNLRQHGVSEGADAVDEARHILAALDEAMRPRAVTPLEPYDQETEPGEMSRMDWEADAHD